MKGERAEGWSRRGFVRGLTLAGTAELVGLRPGPADADPPPETTKLRLYEALVDCIVPQYAAQELLHCEGFTDVRYVKFPSETQAYVPECPRGSPLGPGRHQPHIRSDGHHGH